MGGIIILLLYFFKSAPVETVSTPAANAVNTPKTIPVKTPEQDLKLQAKSDSYLKLFDKMPSVPVYLNDEPILKGGTNTEHGVAYTDCIKNKIPTIYIKRIFYANANDKQLTNILKHELTHAWLCRKELMNGHDEPFRKKFKEVGGFGN